MEEKSKEDVVAVRPTRSLRASCRQKVSKGDVCSELKKNVEGINKMSKINCQLWDCKFNKDGVCQKDEVSIDTRPVCLSARKDRSQWEE